MVGHFLTVEGIDGSGKSSAISSIREYAIAKGMKILDVKAACEQGRAPSEDEVAEADIIFTSEPTYFFVGKAIRSHLITPGSKYPARTLAHAYALDREILYSRIIIPALKRKKLVVSERGVASSIIYQPVQDKIRLDELMRIPGNALAMKYPPDLLLLLRVPADEALMRVNDKLSKTKSIFDNLIFQRTIAERYASVWLRTLFERLGTRVIYFDTGKPATSEQNQQNAVTVFSQMAGGNINSSERQERL